MPRPSRGLQIAATCIQIGLSVWCAASAESPKPLAALGEAVDGEGVWVSPTLDSSSSDPVTLTVWFDRQFLGDGKAYSRRAEKFSGALRRELRSETVDTLKKLSNQSHAAAEPSLNRLIREGKISNLKRHWIVNGFTCTTKGSVINDIAKLPGVKKIFVGRRTVERPKKPLKATLVDSPDRPGQPTTDELPWYIEALQADRVWKELQIAGEGTLNVIQDNNFIISPSLTRAIYQNPREIPNNGKDDDGNGLIDDSHGYHFDLDAPVLTTKKLVGDRSDRRTLHGTSCANIICGAATESGTPQFGIAPLGRWAGVISKGSIEAAVEWAIEQEADTYSMSFSIPALGESRSHWRKIMEHGSFCGLYFVSGAGNFAQTTKIPVQMRTPEDIPEAVFAAAGVQRDLSRTPFSSTGPVEWNTEHYKDGRVQKPEVCAFNYKIPLLMPDGSVSKDTLNGNSFAGPMFCGTIALMLSADPDLLPWDLKDIITSTASDVGPTGVDDQTGHGLINCYKAVEEVIRRRDLRSATDTNSDSD